MPNALIVIWILYCNLFVKIWQVYIRASGTFFKTFFVKYNNFVIE